MDKNNTYYYAQKKRVPLQKTEEYLSVDVNSLDDSDESDFVRKAAKSLGEHLRRGHYLMKQKDLPKTVYKKLASLGAAQAVFRSGANLVVVLPEIRVRVSEKDELNSLKKWLGEHVEAAVKTLGNRVTLRPVSKSGTEALEIANRIHEEVEAASAEPRMMQLVERR